MDLEQCLCGRVPMLFISEENTRPSVELPLVTLKEIEVDESEAGDDRKLFNISVNNAEINPLTYPSADI